MTVKEKVVKLVRSLPANASIEDAMERLLFFAKIEKGRRQADSGRTVSHDKVEEKMTKWLK
jgi:predicted transcriptional regulator